MVAGGDFEEVSMASMANQTCITSNGGTRNGTVLVDLSGEKPKNIRRERKTIPSVHNNHNRQLNGHNGHNGKLHVDRRVSSPSGPS